MPRKIVTVRRWEVVIAFVMVTASYVIGLWLIVHLNNERIADINKSRLESCQRTYEGVRQVFRVFFPDDPKGEQAQDIHKFNRRVDALKRGCERQTATKGDRK